MTQPPSLIAAPPLLPHTAGIHEYLPAPGAHSGEASFPRSLDIAFAQQTCRRVEAACRLGAELATNHSLSLSKCEFAGYTEVTLTGGPLVDPVVVSRVQLLIDDRGTTRPSTGDVPAEVLCPAEKQRLSSLGVIAAI